MLGSDQGVKHTMAKDGHNQAKSRSANLPHKVDVRSLKTPDGGQRGAEACMSPTQRSKEKSGTPMFDQLVQRITSPGLKQLLSPGHVGSLFNPVSCCKPETSTDAFPHPQRGASPASSSKPPSSFHLGSASLRQRPRSTTPTSGLRSKSSTFESATQIAHRVLSDPNAPTVSPSQSITPADKPRARITSRLNSRDGPSSPIDEQELVDLSLDVDPVLSVGDSEDEGSSGASRSPTPLPARSPPQIVHMLSPADAAQLMGPELSSRLSPLLSRLPVRLRSMLSPGPQEVVGGQSSPFHRFDRPEAQSPQASQPPTQSTGPATQNANFHMRPPVRPAGVGLRPYCITHTVAPRRPFAPPTSSNSLQTMRTLRSPAPNPILAKPNKPVPGSSSRVDTAKAAGITTVLLGLMQATVAAMLSVTSWKGGGTWWAGLTCVIAGLLGLQTPTLRPLTIARPEAATIAGVLAAMTLVVGLLLSMAQWQLLRQATVCGSPDTVLRDYSYQGGTGTQTLGAACGFSSGCSCVPLASLSGTQAGDSLTCSTVAFQPRFLGCGSTQQLLSGMGLASVGLQVVLLALVVTVLSTRRRPTGHNVGGLFVGWDREKRMRRSHSQPWAVVTPAPRSPSSEQDDKEEIEEEEIISIAAY